MRVAALYDIHANLPALEAVVRDVRRDEIDRIIVGGDVLPGPMPLETMAFLRGLDIPVEFIRGNGDREVLALLDGDETGGVPEKFRHIVKWTARQLQSDDVLMIAAWQPTLRFEIAGIGDVLFCHATPRSDTEMFTRETPEENLLPVFAEVRSSLVVCGHTHMQFDRMIGSVRVVNAGSVGMPFGERGAYWLQLGPAIQLRRTEYDYAAAAERIRSTQYPEADDFAARNVLHPPVEQEVLEQFRRVEIKRNN
jgi:putative phosphoesterase